MSQSTALHDATQVDRAAGKQSQAFRRINHIAIAVRDLEASINLFQNVLGFELKKRRQKGDTLAADMECNGMYFVLCQGVDEHAEFSQLVDRFGVGVAHIALDVDDVDSSVEALTQRGLAFDTGVIRETGVTHAFTTRDEHTGLCIEVIRCGN